jgi:hypothetical protein
MSKPPRYSVVRQGGDRPSSVGRATRPSTTSARSSSGNHPASLREAVARPVDSVRSQRIGGLRSDSADCVVTSTGRGRPRIQLSEEWSSTGVRAQSSDSRGNSSVKRGFLATTKVLLVGLAVMGTWGAIRHASRTPPAAPSTANAMRGSTPTVAPAPPATAANAAVPAAAAIAGEGSSPSPSIQILSLDPADGPRETGGPRAARAARARTPTPSEQSSTYRDLARKARRLLAQGHLPEGIAAAEQANAADPAEADGYILLAAGLEDARNLALAEQVYHRCAATATKGPIHLCRHFEGAAQEK